MDKKKKIDLIKMGVSVAAIAGGFIVINDVVDRNVRDGNIITKTCVGLAKLVVGCMMGDTLIKTVDKSVNNVVHVYDDIESQSIVK